jgi:hypothetical protein
VTVNKTRSLRRRKILEARVGIPADDIDSYPDPRLDASWAAHYAEDLFQRACEMVRPLVEDTTWKIFMRVYVDRQLPATVAREFGVSRNKVYVAQCRCLARVRAIVGPKAVVGAEYDLHCHLTEKRVAACDLVVLFKEFPHTDFLARAEELVDLAVRTHRGEIRPVMRTFDCRTLQGAFMTNQPLGRAFVDRIMAMEGKDGVLSISVAHGFSAGDVPEVGTRTLVITDGDPDKASRLAVLPPTKTLAIKTPSDGCLRHNRLTSIHLRMNMSSNPCARTASSTRWKFSRQTRRVRA